MNKFSFFLLTFVGLLLSFEGCKAKEDLTATTIGTPQIIGNGKVNTHFTLNELGNVRTLGITFGKGALDSLPDSIPSSIALTLPDDAKAKTPFQFVMLNYYPLGHQPVGTYDTAHFDVLFYFKKNTDVMAITAADTVKAKNYPPAGYIPSSYAPRLFTPMLGVEWWDSTLPEFYGVPFTYSFGFGSYDGSVTFYEAMATVESMKKKLASTYDIKMPDNYNPSGLYPTQYTARYDVNKEEYIIEFMNFVKK